MEFIKNRMLQKVLTEYFPTFALTLDTVDFVPENYLKKIVRAIYKDMKKSLRKANREYRKIIRAKWLKAFKAKHEKINNVNRLEALEIQLQRVYDLVKGGEKNENSQRQI